MALQLDLDYAAELAPHEFERFASLIDPAWIAEALQQTGRSHYDAGACQPNVWYGW